MKYGWRIMTLYRRQESRPSPKKEMQKSKMAVWGGLTNSCEKKRSQKMSSGFPKCWVKHKLESRSLGEISITSDMQMTPPLWQKAKKNLKSLLMKVKEESEKVA